MTTRRARPTLGRQLGGKLEKARLPHRLAQREEHEVGEQQRQLGPGDEQERGHGGYECADDHHLVDGDFARDGRNDRHPQHDDERIQYVDEALHVVGYGFGVRPRDVLRHHQPLVGKQCLHGKESENEIAEGTVTVKFLREQKQQQTISQSELNEFLKNKQVLLFDTVICRNRPLQCQIMRLLEFGKLRRWLGIIIVTTGGDQNNTEQ